ncbi:hypothetical protein TPL01_11630 [Sulfuriferula plumbiphila]|uniref:Glycine zipper 2TM domain-containing protein n=2 Tax=Sulfuriferula plumbiphila TaxID=171865 RepID=A0A512L6C2_9PROT|nr:hypothetical protein SFPGR_10460 [Sulfuriferula plumbiphila]GEP30025.1 hypothetical protein TPL01_11630 [Sulfuriferula plumbiphila]
MGWLPASTGNSGVNTTVQPEKESAAISQPANTKTHHPETARKEQHKTSERPANNAPARIRCNECGVVEDIRALDTRGQGSGVGAVGGAVVGGVLGHQVGGGRGKEVATVAGALGGAFAGNEIEKRVKSETQYEIAIRFEDGSRQVFTETNPPTWRAGDRVRVVNGEIRSSD